MMYPGVESFEKRTSRMILRGFPSSKEMAKREKERRERERKEREEKRKRGEDEKKQ